ncbi:TlpA family protein disulfide reductase [Methylopila turkensis]|uniref:Thiol:disulfide interchange protein n=1 Tax=Methylopila turkensis TaxID=1437816 RepID=A0A9W6N7T5_9HYPH|nr:TlpA disulfide reductase family protein [Methylopila turkensis]GLK80755.1 thiol:disulfide interchange protein [Methylopila turkensis]
MTAIRHFRRSALAAAIALPVLSGAAGATPEYAAFEPLEAVPTASSARALDGETVTLGPAADRPVLVHFFATWCAPCEEELPELARFAAARGETVRVVGVDVAEPASRVAAFVAPLGLGFPVTLDEDRAIARAFGVRALPSTVLIASGGGSAMRAAGPVDWSAPAIENLVEHQRIRN